MSREQNIELARRGYEALSRRDVAAVLDFLDAEIEIHDFPDVPDRATYRGKEGFIALFRNVVDQFDDFRIEPEEIVAPDEEHLLVLVRTVGRGKVSGAEVEARVVHLWTIQDGKAVELRLHADKDEAFEAAGLWK